MQKPTLHIDKHGQAETGAHSSDGLHDDTYSPFDILLGRVKMHQTRRTSIYYSMSDHCKRDSPLLEMTHEQVAEEVKRFYGPSALVPRPELIGHVRTVVRSTEVMPDDICANPDGSIILIYKYDHRELLIVTEEVGIFTVIGDSMAGHIVTSISQYMDILGQFFCGGSE